MKPSQTGWAFCLFSHTKVKSILRQSRAIANCSLRLPEIRSLFARKPWISLAAIRQGSIFSRNPALPLFGRDIALAVLLLQLGVPAHRQPNDARDLPHARARSRSFSSMLRSLLPLRIDRFVRTRPGVNGVHGAHLAVMILLSSHTPLPRSKPCPRRLPPSALALPWQFHRE